jgi:tetratricopeptide (TPR) repeat protein
MFASHLITRFFIFCSFAVCLGGNSLALAEHEIKSSRTNLSGNQADQQSLLKSIDLLISKGDFALASEEVLKAIERVGGEKNAEGDRFLDECLGRGESFRLSNKERDWLPVLDKAVQLRPSNAGYHSARSQVLCHVGRYQEALKEILLARQLTPSDLCLRHLQCCYLNGLHRDKEVLKEASAALALAPNDYRLHADKYDALCRMGRRDEAMQEITKAVEGGPQDANCRYLHADCLMHENRLGEAEMEFSKAVELDPSNEIYRLSLLFVLCAQSKKEQVDKCLNEWLVYGKRRSKPDIVAHASMKLHFSPFENEEAEPLRGYKTIYERLASNSQDFDCVAVGAYCALGENQQAMKALKRVMGRANPLTGCEHIVSLLNLYSPNTIAHVYVLDEIAHVLQNMRKGANSNSSEIGRLTAIQRQLDKTRTYILVALCQTGPGYKEGIEVLRYLEDQRRKGQLNELLYAGLVNLQTHYGNFSAALSEASEGLRTYPKSSGLMKLRATVNDILGRKKESLADIKQIQSGSKEAIKPEKFGALKSGMLGSLLPMYNNDRQGFDLAYKQALQAENEKLTAATSPDRKAQILLRKAELEIYAKDYEGALKIIEEAVKVGGNSSKSYELSAWALEGLKKHEQAAEARRAALALFEKK